MCSGLTAYAALKRHTNRPERGPVLLIGLGGVGMMGLAIARALFTTPPIVADIDAEKRNAALVAGAAQAYDPSDPQARKAVMSATGGGLLAICDFVGSDKSLQFATGLVARGGKVVVTGLLGGNFSIAAAMFGIGPAVQPAPSNAPAMSGPMIWPKRPMAIPQPAPVDRIGVG